MCSASESLLVKEMFQANVTRTGSIAPSLRQTRERRVSHAQSNKRLSRIPDFKSAREFFRVGKTGTGKKVELIWFDGFEMN